MLEILSSEKCIQSHVFNFIDTLFWRLAKTPASSSGEIRNSEKRLEAQFHLVASKLVNLQFSLSVSDNTAGVIDRSIVILGVKYSFFPKNKWFESAISIIILMYFYFERNGDG